MQFQVRSLVTNATLEGHLATVSDICFSEAGVAACRLSHARLVRLPSGLVISARCVDLGWDAAHRCRRRVCVSNDLPVALGHQNHGDLAPPSYLTCIRFAPTFRGRLRNGGTSARLSLLRCWPRTHAKRGCSLVYTHLSGEFWCMARFHGASLSSRLLPALQ